MSVLPVGTKLTCPECGRVVARVTTEIKTGMRLMAKYFEPVEGIIEPGTKMECPFDGVAFSRRKRDRWFYEVHTSEGWR